MDTYRLIVLGDGGMYTYGDLAASPELARLAVGNLLRATIQSGCQPLRLGVVREDRPGTAGSTHRRVLVEAEGWPGQWTIGVPGSSKYSPGLPRDVGVMVEAVRLDDGDPVAKMALADALEDAGRA